MRARAAAHSPLAYRPYTRPCNERSGWRHLVLASEKAAGASACPALRSRSAARIEWRGRGRVRGGRTTGSASAKLIPMRGETKYDLPNASAINRIRSKEMGKDAMCGGGGRRSYSGKMRTYRSGSPIQRYSDTRDVYCPCRVASCSSNGKRRCLASGTGGSDSVSAVSMDLRRNKGMKRRDVTTEGLHVQKQCVGVEGVLCTGFAHTSCPFTSHEPQRPPAQRSVWRRRRDLRLSRQMGEDTGKAECERCGVASRDEVECKCDEAVPRAQRSTFSLEARRIRRAMRRVRIESERTEARARERGEDGRGECEGLSQRIAAHAA
ncbi:hypothetical protein B0H13DRAFT_2488688 [Mycena leptocephala]|nr:hypothetical protein B0H13DRAFT_2488688 [Mycena leptocephala]